MTPYKRTFALLAPFWKQLTLASVSSAFHALLSGLLVWMVGPLMMTLFNSTEFSAMGLPGEGSSAEIVGGVTGALKGWVEAIVAAETPAGTLARFCALILGVVLLRNLFYYIQWFFMSYVQESTVRMLRDRLFAKYQRLSLTFFHKQRTGDIISRITNDVGVFNLALDIGFNRLIGDGVLVVVLFSFLLMLSLKLTLVSLIVLPVIFGFVWFIGKKLRKYSERSQEKMGEVSSVVEEAVNNVRIIKAFSMESFEEKKFFRATGDYFRSLLRMARIRHLASPINDTLVTAAGVLILFVAGAEILAGTGELGAGDFITFVVAMFSLVKPVKSLTQIHVKLQEGMAAATRIFDVFDQPETIVDQPNPKILTGLTRDIRYRDVSFHYVAGISVLDHVSFTVSPGETVAIVGPSGAGKSTLVDLLPRFYDPIMGCVEIDGIDIRKYSLTSLRGLMGIVTQDTILFNDTIRSNIAYGLSDVSDEKLLAATKMANAHDFIVRLENGYETQVGNRGVKLSGGQKQRVAIARALLKNPQILIFDEATSALDTESEQQVQEAIERLLVDRTVLVIAHRLSTVKNADRILVLENGRIVESGKHAELLEQEKLYARLYAMQFADTT